MVVLVVLVLLVMVIRMVVVVVVLAALWMLSPERCRSKAMRRADDCVVTRSK